MSNIQLQFIAGKQKLMPQLLCMLAPTVNSYSRLIPGFWAPTDATWGIDNRTTALRVIPGSEKSQRVEHRVGAADANPYLPWPPHLEGAAQTFKTSAAAGDLFGNSFVAHFAGTQEWEEREFRKYINDWELQRYFEII